MSDLLLPYGMLVARQAPLSVGFSRQEYWSGLPFSPPGDLKNVFTYTFIESESVNCAYVSDSLRPHGL